MTQSRVYLRVTSTVLSVLLCLILVTSALPKFPRMYVQGGSQNRGSNSSFKIVCYYGMSGTPYTSILPPDMNVELCTHIIVLSTSINNSQITFPPNYVDLYFSKVPLMKKQKPSLQVILSNGDPLFGHVLASEDARQMYATSSVPLLRKYGFDGLDLDWEYPALAQRRNFTLLVQAVREAFDNDVKQHGGSHLQLTAAVASIDVFIELGYEIANLAKYLDFVNLMTYDMHVPSVITPYTGYNGPLFVGKGHKDQTVFKNFSIEWASHEWVRQGMRYDQVMVGIPTYARPFTLYNAAHHGLYDPAYGPFPLGTQISYKQVCDMVQKPSTTVVWDDDCKVPYAYQDVNWLSYDNEKSVTLKTEYIQSQGFGGVMTFSLNSDDFAGSCDGTTKWPLHVAINKAVKKSYNVHSQSSDTKPWK